MAKNSPALTINLFPKQDYLIIKWLSVMGETRPRYASIYAREAIHQYIKEGTYLSLGSVAIEQTFLDTATERTFSVLKDDTIVSWIQELSKANLKAGPYVRAILNKCIQQSSDGNNHIPDIVDLKQIAASIPAFLPKTAETTVSTAAAVPASPHIPQSPVPEVGEESSRKNEPAAKPKSARMSNVGIIGKLGAKLDDD